MSSFAILGDEQLARLAVGGDRAAFSELMRRHASGVRVLLRRMGAPPTVADDLAQDACLRAFERIGSFRLEGSFAGWLNRIAARMYIRRWRVESRFTLDSDSVEELDLQDARAVNAVNALDLDRALPLLSAAERVCVTLCIGVGLTHPEAAEELQIPLGTVKSHVHRGLVKLRAHFACGTEEETPKRVRA